MDGTLYYHSPNEPPAFILFDAVPGGAGHARQLEDPEQLATLFRSAYQRVATCLCGEETSCYGCLRSYGNQRFHEQLSRGAAEDLLGRVLAA